MSKSYGSKDLTETFQDFLTGAAKVLFGLGMLASVISAALLVFTCFRVSGDTALSSEAIKNISILQQVLNVGITGVAISSTYLFWGEELLGAIQLILAGALYFAPAYLPGMLGGSTNEAIARALSALQVAGTILGLIALLVLGVDISRRVMDRAKNGAKADQLKFGKGVKEEADRQNVFLGRCWQLPYCRKFVRERCPIFHAKRTCWKEKVGCMCEEEVIRNAMENKPVPKDQLLAANYIPRNQRLTPNQKIERCRTCVIYNEHQRHKYRAWLPGILLFFIVSYVGLHGPLVGVTNGIVQKINEAVNYATLRGASMSQAPTVFVEGLLFVFMLVAMTYALKILEFLIFKLKI